MITALIHFPRYNQSDEDHEREWTLAWYTIRQIYNESLKEGIETTREVKREGSCMVIKALNNQEKFDAIVKKIL